MLMAKRYGQCETYEKWIEPKIVRNALELLDKEIPKLKDEIKWVHLCFSSDPFMCGYPEVTELSLKIIKKVNESGIKVTTLTKGVYPDDLKNYENYSINIEYGITLVSLHEDFRQRYEPYTADYNERIQGLKKLHIAGAKTWVSIEPYPTPNMVKQGIGKILSEVSFVDKIIFGRLNYNAKVSEYPNYGVFYNSCAKEVIAFCRTKNIAYYIKKGTYTASFEECERANP